MMVGFILSLTKFNKCIFIFYEFFRNDPHEISDLFRVVLLEEGFSKYFDKIVFPMVDPEMKRIFEERIIKQ